MFNYGQKKKEWQKIKTEEEKILRKNHIDEKVIQKLHQYDLEIFKKERSYQNHIRIYDLSNYPSKQSNFMYETAQGFLDSFEDERLYHLLKNDSLLLQILYLKEKGFLYKEIAEILGLSEHQIYYRIKKMKKNKNND